MTTTIDKAQVSLPSDTEVRVTRYPQRDFARLVERIRQRKPDGYTALYDALGVYLDGADQQNGRSILVMYTDGGDTRSVRLFSQILERGGRFKFLSYGSRLD